jgi:predicted Rossmann fold nucleotide-binding protein DprA/Smf involved in DNA uptake
LISALSEATLVMEGGERSGSLITARHAKEQGKDVYAFPGNVGNNGSEASSLLIKNGAKLFTSADDILRDYEIRGKGKMDPFKLSCPVSVDMATVLRDLEVSCVAPNDPIFYSHSSKTEKSVPKTPEVKKVVLDDSSNEDNVRTRFSPNVLAIYKKIPLNREISVDDLVDENLSLRDVMQGLLTLEISKFVTMLPGDRVKRNI